MMDNKSVVRVRIVGEEYTLRTEASTAHTEAVAEARRIAKEAAGK